MKAQIQKYRNILKGSTSLGAVKGAFFDFFEVFLCKTFEPETR